MKKLYTLIVLAGTLLLACSSPDATAPAPLTTDTLRTDTMPADTGVVKAMDSTINTPDKRPDK